MDVSESLEDPIKQGLIEPDVSDTQTVTKEDSVSESTTDSVFRVYGPAEVSAAIKIQTAFRGYLVKCTASRPSAVGCSYVGWTCS